MIQMLQLEFPYTRDGALNAYNEAQLSNMRVMYNNLINEQQNPHYIPNSFEEFILNNISYQGPLFARQNSHLYMDKAVEKQTNKALDSWMDNRLHGDHPVYKKLEDVLTSGDKTNGNF